MHSISAYALCFKGDVEAVREHVIHNTEFDPSVGLEGACDGNQPSLIPILLQAGVTNIRSCLLRCIDHGFTECYDALINQHHVWDAHFFHTIVMRGYASGNPDFIKSVNIGLLPEDKLKYAAIHQRHDLIDDILTQYPGVDTGYIANGASIAGNIELVKAYLNQDCVYAVIANACKHGYTHLVRYCLDNFELDLDIVIRHAYVGQHVNISARDEIIAMVMDAGGANYDKGLEGACEGSHNDLIERMLVNGADITSGIYGAIKGNHVEIAQRMIELKAQVDQNVLLCAAMWGAVDVIPLLLHHDFVIVVPDQILRELEYYDDGYAIMTVSKYIKLDYIKWMTFANKFRLIRLAKALMIEGRLPFNSCSVPMSWFHIMDLYTHGISEVGKYQPQLDQYITQVTAVVSQTLPTDLAKLITTF